MIDHDDEHRVETIRQHWIVQLGIHFDNVLIALVIYEVGEGAVAALQLLAEEVEHSFVVLPVDGAGFAHRFGQDRGEITG